MNKLKILIAMLICVSLAISLCACDTIEGTNSESSIQTISVFSEEDSSQIESIIENSSTADSSDTSSEDTPSQNVSEDVSLAVTSSGNNHEHNFSVENFAPNCKEKGYNLYTCECGYSYKDNFSDSEHYWGDWTEITPATTESTGIKRQTCLYCGTTEDRVIPKLKNEHTHSYSTSVYVAPTVNSEGYTEHRCSCGDYYRDSYTPKLDNSTVDPSISVKQTIGGPRYYNSLCSVTDKRSWGVAPTITVYGSGYFHVAYYNKSGNIVEFNMEPPAGKIMMAVIFDDGTYQTNTISPAQ